MSAEFKSESFKFKASDGKDVHCYRWSSGTEPRALVHIAHGMGEHAARYDWTARKLCAQGFEVSANDHRGHGETAEVLGDFGEDGWNRAIKDLLEIIQMRRSQYPGKPVILFGHSMGSMLSQQYIARHGETIDLVILSGSPGAGSRFQGWLLHTIAKFESWRLGNHATSPLLQSLLFGSANKAFDDEPGATGYEWLSRDPGTVKQYVEDPFCGFVPCCMSICDLFEAERANWTKQAVAGIPGGLPVYVFSGSADPVHNGMKNITRMLDFYRHHGLAVTTRFYPEGRHEMLNETNREAVITDTCQWLNAALD